MCNGTILLRIADLPSNVQKSSDTKAKCLLPDLAALPLRMLHHVGGLGLVHATK